MALYVEPIRMQAEQSADFVFCDPGQLQHPRYFAGQLMTPIELTLEHEYLRDKLRRHNRLMHGWGVVFGAKVQCVTDSSGNLVPWKVKITPGYVLGPYGDEIVISNDASFALNSEGMTGISGDPRSAMTDPWCSIVEVKPKNGVLYVAVKYKEVMSRPVKTPMRGAGCGDSGCEYTRMCDGYEFGVLDTCPDSHKSPRTLNSSQGLNDQGLNDLMEGKLQSTLDCPDSPWVVLAEVNINDSGKITSIDDCICRRIVPSFANILLHCPDATVQINQVNVEGGKVVVGTNAKVTVIGSNFPTNSENLVALFGEGTKAEIHPVSVDKVQITLKVEQSASPGKRDLILSGSHWQITKQNAIEITSP